jgi:hypothetical protein
VGSCTSRGISRQASRGRPGLLRPRGALPRMWLHGCSHAVTTTPATLATDTRGAMCRPVGAMPPPPICLILDDWRFLNSPPLTFADPAGRRLMNWRRRRRPNLPASSQMTCRHLEMCSKVTGSSWRRDKPFV